MLRWSFLSSKWIEKTNSHSLIFEFLTLFFFHDERGMKNFPISFLRLRGRFFFTHTHFHIFHIVLAFGNGGKNLGNGETNFFWHLMENWETIVKSTQSKPQFAIIYKFWVSEIENLKHTNNDDRREKWMIENLTRFRCWLPTLLSSFDASYFMSLLLLVM